MRLIPHDHKVLLLADDCELACLGPHHDIEAIPTVNLVLVGRTASNCFFIGEADRLFVDREGVALPEHNDALPGRHEPGRVEWVET